MAEHGLTPSQLSTIKAVLMPYRDKTHQVGLFGSRAVGTARPNSNVDLILYGDLTQADIDRLWTLFDLSPLAIKVDVNAYHLINYPPLKRHIDEVMQPLLWND